MYVEVIHRTDAGTLIYHIRQWVRKKRRIREIVGNLNLCVLYSKNLYAQVHTDFIGDLNEVPDDVIEEASEVERHREFDPGPVNERNPEENNHE